MSGVCRRDLPRAAVATPVRLLVADREELLRRGLSLLLGAAEGIEVVGEVGEGGELLRAVAALAPDAVLLDLDLPPIGGLRTCERLVRAQRGIRVVMLGGAPGRPSAHALSLAGAAAAVVRETPTDEMARVVHRLVGVHRR